MQNPFRDRFADGLHDGLQVAFRRIDFAAGDGFAQFAQDVAHAGSFGAVAGLAFQVLAMALDCGLVTLCQRVTSSCERQWVAHALRCVNFVSSLERPSAVC